MIFIDVIALHLISIDLADFISPHLCYADCFPLDCDCLNSSLYSAQIHSR